MYMSVVVVVMVWGGVPSLSALNVAVNESEVSSL